MPLPALFSWGAAAAVATIVAVLRAGAPPRCRALLLSVRRTRPAQAARGRAGPRDFAPGACERVEPYLLGQLVGQDLAVRQLCDAVCDHVAAERPGRPLVLSVHGPPGVGKSLLHLLLARALYSAQPSAELRCPGPDCAGYKARRGCAACPAPRWWH